MISRCIARTVQNSPDHPAVAEMPFACRLSRVFQKAVFRTVFRSQPQRSARFVADSNRYCRDDGRTPASYRGTPDGRTPASGSVGHQRPNHQDTSVLQEHPRNIQGTSTSGNSGNSRASSDKSAGKKTDVKLIAFCVEWNAWHSAGIVRLYGRPIARFHGSRDECVDIGEFSPRPASLAGSDRICRPCPGCFGGPGRRFRTGERIAQQARALPSRQANCPASETYAQCSPDRQKASDRMPPAIHEQVSLRRCEPLSR